ncbi:hypothetical protein F4778DRAFT_723221 [Xylariomycetidae sp. FL2044]|nr:hypothetical protein F4778DRAFT_723221 [Xylariomycetidae sp. FL2044]
MMIITMGFLPWYFGWLIVFTAAGLAAEMATAVYRWAAGRLEGDDGVDDHGRGIVKSMYFVMAYYRLMVALVLGLFECQGGCLDCLEWVIRCIFRCIFRCFRCFRCFLWGESSLHDSGTGRSDGGLLACRDMGGSATLNEKEGKGGF